MTSRWRLMIGCLILLVVVSLYENAMYYVHVRSFYKDFLYFQILRFVFADHSAMSIYAALPELPRSNNASAPNCIVDIGAHDGVFTSNSYFPIHSKGYRAFLFEMDAMLCARLTQLYDGNPNVRVYCAGLSSANMVRPYRMFSIGLENTLQKSVDHQYDRALGSTERMAILLDAHVVCTEMALFNCQHRILSIDIEGHEPVVLPRINCTFDLVISETPLTHSRNCKKLFRKQFNDVYECDPNDSVLATQ